MSKPNPFYPVVAIFGRKGVGKSTFAGMLETELKSDAKQWHPSCEVPEYLLAGATRYSFAAPLKSIVSSVLGVPLSKIEELKNKDEIDHNGWTVPMRQILQKTGQFFRDIHPTVWIDKAVRLAMTNALIIDDGRYLNEFDSIKSIGGFCIVISRDRYKELREEQAPDTHPSETGIREILSTRDVCIRGSGYFHENTHSLSDMKQIIKELVVPRIYAHFNRPKVPQ